MSLTPPLSTGSASEIGVRVRLSFTGPTMLRRIFKVFQMHKVLTWRLLFFCTLLKERIDINRVAREIVFQPLHPDTGAPLLEERDTF